MFAVLANMFDPRRLQCVRFQPTCIQLCIARACCQFVDASAHSLSLYSVYIDTSIIHDNCKSAKPEADDARARDALRWMSSGVYGREGSKSAVTKQPESREEKLEAYRAMVSCPTGLFLLSNACAVGGVYAYKCA
jgi:hypothetical protein